MSVLLHLYLRVADSSFLALDFSLLNGCVADGSLWVWSWVTADKGWFSQQLGGSLAGFPHPLAPVVFSVKTCALQLCSKTHFKGPWPLPHLRQGLGVRSKEEGAHGGGLPRQSHHLQWQWPGDREKGLPPSRTRTPHRSGSRCTQREAPGR